MIHVERCHRLKSLSVVGGFLDGLHIEFTDGLNCLIGARGTGKTTVLEFVRYAMDALPGEPAARRRVESLIESNLAGGRVQVAVQTKDGLSYTISRSPGEDPVVLAENGTPTQLSVRAGGLFSVDIFSQNEVESIADQAHSQLDLIDAFEAAPLAGIEQRVRGLKADLKANASRILPLQQKIAAIAEQLAALPGVEEKLKGLIEEGGEDAKAINAAHASKALRDREHRAIGATMEALSETHQRLEAGLGRIGQRQGSIFTGEMRQGPNGQLIEQIGLNLTGCGEDVDRLLGQALRRIESTAEGIEALAGELDLAHKQQEMGFRALIEEHKQAQSKATERSRLERLRNELLVKAREKDQAAEAMGQLKAQRVELLQALSELRDERFTLRQRIASRINATLAPAVRVGLVQFGNPQPYRDLLEEALRGHRMRQNQVAGKVIDAFWPAQLVEVVQEKNTQALVDKAELNAEQAEKLIAALEGCETLFELEIVELIDLPRIELNDGGVYKATAELSTGQKCTTILPILLMDSDNPLLIDQPEDNLDNRFVFETIVESIGKVKQKRQLIFVTHNPNIPVLGDADRVFVLESDGTQARQACRGSVDQCKASIVTLLEGGEDAFKRRKHRYAY